MEYQKNNKKTIQIQLQKIPKERYISLEKRQKNY